MVRPFPELIDRTLGRDPLLRCSLPQKSHDCTIVSERTPGDAVSDGSNCIGIQSMKKALSFIELHVPLIFFPIAPLPVSIKLLQTVTVMPNCSLLRYKFLNHVHLQSGDGCGVFLALAADR